MKAKNNIKCNKCGREILVENGIIREGVFEINYEWSYFSNKDGEVHKIILCEKCYDKIVNEFKIPIDIEEKTEMI